MGLAASVVLGVSGVGVFLVGRSIPGSAEFEVQGPVAPVNKGALDPLDIRAHNSPLIARNPKNPSNLIAANRVDTPSFSCALHYSTNGGRQWNETTVPIPEGEEAKCFWPDVAIDRDGTAYLMFVTLKGVANIPNGVWISKSLNGGKTLSAPDLALGPNAFGVRLVTDPLEGGRLYLTWVQAAEVANFGFVKSGNPINLARSDDGGSTWQGPVRISPVSRNRSIAPSVAVGPRGELYVTYLDLRNDRLDYHGEHEGRGGQAYRGHWQLVLARSLNLGGSWDEVVIDSLAPTHRFLAFFPPLPSVAVDQSSGKVYASFYDRRAGDADIYLWISTDRGRRYGKAVRVNDTRRGDATSQYLPSLDVAPDGRVDVLYYDRRADPRDRTNEVSFQSSFDEGMRFHPRVRLSDRPFDSWIGFGSERAMPELGSRLGLVSTEAGALGIWADTRGGSQASNKQDLGMAAVRISPRPWLTVLRLPLQGLGALLALLAGAILALQLRRPSVSSHVNHDRGTL